MSNIPKKWLTVMEAAAYLGVTRHFLDCDRCTRLHGIPFARLGRCIRYRLEDLDTWLEQRMENKFSNIPQGSISATAQGGRDG